MRFNSIGGGGNMDALDTAEQMLLGPLYTG